ncbi:S41 family peptidase [Mucilaginibacter corticis]|uniref:S41 family peptidase n=1 Tax=Mucilaginibacter corticis TaxID=2597670 RepID=A0A556MVQ1_9SPHI|nr:S41 family peptidase [Mucilaginibacter corticis]TSJ43987.1 S41 family peptidase [Mucilaginibacter corticis]
MKATFIKQTGRAICVATVLLLGNSLSTFAQTVSDADAHEIVTKLGDRLVDVYPFPEISEKYKADLLKNEAAGHYHSLTETELAAKLTADMRATHKDVHLRVSRNEESYKNMTEPRGNRRGGARTSEDNSNERANYGFKRVEIDGTTSTAYVEIPGPFLASEEALDIAAASMNMCAFSKYVILDVRHNPGGTGQMGRFLASYFYPTGREQFYLNGFYKDRTRDEQEWTYTYVPGRHMPDAKVYILTSRGTGSASEGFAYAMQQLKRATIVGDTSAGAGIAGGNVALKNNLVAFVPVKMVVGPHDNHGWEGTGVIPDVETGKDDALAATHKLILQDILANSVDTLQKAAAQWVLDDSGIASNAATNMKAKYGDLVGKYSSNITITYIKGDLLWNRVEPGKPTESYPLKEVKPDVLVAVGLNANIGPNVSRIYINRDAKGKVESLTRKTLGGNGRISTTGMPIKKV